MAALPTSRHFVTQLLNSLPSSKNYTNDDATTNPLSTVDEPTKKQLLSLQVLFPNEFLPALDLLDRHLVTRMTILNALHQDTTTASEPSEALADQAMLDTAGPIEHAAAPRLSHDENDAIYFVRSAQQRSSRYSTSYDTSTSYEVRLRAWNCSCPAFAFAAFPNTHLPPTTATSTASDTTAGDEGWVFGGVSLGDAMPPVCKHLLACVLVERCEGLFGGFVEERVVSVEEAAGWAAGWGDS